MAKRINYLNGGIFDNGNTVGVQTANLCQVDLPENSAGFVKFIVVGRDTTTPADVAVFEVVTSVSRAAGVASIGAAIPALVGQVTGLIGVVAPVPQASGNGVRCPCVGIAGRTIEWQVAAWGMVN